MTERQNLAAFTKHLGYKNAPFHKEWYNVLQNEFSPFRNEGTKKRLIRFWPRGHGKSECTSFNYVSWLVGNNRNVHINIVSKTASLAEEILLALMTRFESDERYIEVFGYLKPNDARKWTTKEIIVNRNEISKNPTIKATGLMGAITGGRSDLIVCDDLIDEENIRTPLQFEKVLTWHNKVLAPTLYPWGGEIIIGTRWHYADLYANLMQIYPYETKKAIIELDTHCTSLWPQYWPLWKLTEKRREIGSIIFECQYQNNPTPMEGDLLKAWWLHPWDERPPSHCRYYAGIDPSLGEADYFGIATLAHDYKVHQGYLEDVWAEHMPFPTILKEKLPQLCKQYNYTKIYIESNFWQKLLFKMPELRGLPIVPIQTVRNKEERFIPMSSHFESKRVLVNPMLLNRGEFWTEWVQFPRGAHDDAVDAVEMVVSNVLSRGAPQVLTGKSLYGE